MGKAKTAPPSYASTGTRDTFGRLYASMAQSGTFQRLSTPAKVLYMLCTIQATSTAGRRALYAHQEAEGAAYGSACFVFPPKHLEYYGVSRSTFQKYMPELETAGFIETVERNKHRRKMNVYRFSEKWKNSS